GLTTIYTRRFIVHTKALGEAEFLELLYKSAEEYGFDSEGILRIAYHEAKDFEEWMITGAKGKVLRWFLQLGKYCSGIVWIKLVPNCSGDLLEMMPTENLRRPSSKYEQITLLLPKIAAGRTVAVILKSNRFMNIKTVDRDTIQRLQLRNLHNPVG
ncbi:SMALL AUXIN-UP RNA-RELATED, partial [Salix viminalis]